MSQTINNKISSNMSYQKNIKLLVIFIFVVVGGLFYVKWSPYYAKALVAASKHSIGDSIISGKAQVAPSPSFEAALSYMTSYFTSVWKAVILGLLIGSLVQVLIPKLWIKKAFGGKNIKSTVFAGLASLPGMMCTCCTAPVAVGLKKSSASTNATLAFFLGNPTLNPATIIFMGFVLGWNFAILRIVIGVILVLGISTFSSRFYNDKQVDTIEPLNSKAEILESNDNLLIKWIKALLQLIIDTIPVYLIIVAILGAFRAWLFPTINPALGNNILVIVGLAIAGTLFVIPTAGEIPIIQALMALGLGTGPAAALLITLPAVSLPSLLLVKRAFSTRILVFVGTATVILGIISGFIGIITL